MEQAYTDRKRILVVEDELGIAKVCMRTLSAEGFQVNVAVSGEAALDMLNRKDFGLCLIDIRTPEMSGIELYGQLQKRHPGMVDKVVFTTGDVLDSDIKSFIESVGKPYLAKPFSLDELRAIVRKALGLAEMC
jgi:DNA-binding response OmpR family regulator